MDRDLKTVSFSIVPDQIGMVFIISWLKSAHIPKYCVKVMIPLAKRSAAPPDSLPVLQELTQQGMKEGIPLHTTY